MVTAIDGDTIEIDAPLACSLDKKYGGGHIYRYRQPGRIEQCGVENLRGDSVFDASIPDPRRKGEYADENHAWQLVTFDKADDCWMRNVTAIHFGYACGEIRRYTRHITIQDCVNLEPVSIVTGARRYSFNMKGTLSLVQRCYSERGRHDYVMHDRAPGPNVFVDCMAVTAYDDTGPHHRWSTGTLYDCLRIDGNRIRIQDRGDWGTAHGWAGANQVVWNCEAEKGFVVQNPPTAQNWAIGCIGPKAKPRLEGRPEGNWDSYGKHVVPRSLYLAQLEERLGEQALENVTTPAQREGMIWKDLQEMGK